MTLLQPPSFLQNRTDHTAQEDRLFFSGTMGAGIGGLALAAGVNLVRAQTVPNMTVLVAKEHFFMLGTENTHQGLYHGYNDGDITVTIAASSPTLPRKDIVYAAVRDAFYSGANNDLVVDKVTGTPNASPVAPAVPANGILLATIDVAANATTVINANITLANDPAVARGGVYSAADVTERDAIVAAVGLYEGMTFYIASMDILERYKASTGWKNILDGGDKTQISFIPGGNLDTPGAGTATWITVGNVTVPAWATKARVIWSIYSYYETTAGALASCTFTLKIGSAAGVTQRIPGSTSTWGMTVTSTDILTGLTTGVQSMTISATFAAGSTWRIDTNSRVMAAIDWLP